MNCSSDIGSFDAFRRKFFAEVISYFKSFSLDEYDLRIFSSVFLIEIFDLLEKELKYTKESLLNHSRKSVQNSEVAARHVWVELKLWSRTTYVRCFEVIHKAAEINIATRINSDKLTETNSAFTNIYDRDNQQSADSNIIQFHLTLKCTKDQSSHFCACFLVSKWNFPHRYRGLTTGKFHAGCEHLLQYWCVSS